MINFKNLFYNLSSIITLVFANKFLYKFNKAILYQSLRNLGYLNDDNDKIVLSGILNNLLKYKKDIKIVFDIGGHHGHWTFSMLENFDINKIYIVEPNENSFKILQNNVKKRNTNKIILINSFLNDQESNIYLFDIQNQGSTVSTRYKDALEAKKYNNINSIEKKTETLDIITQREKITNIDLIKIDCEGNELNILKGSKITIEKIKPKFILFENNFHSLITGASIYQIKKILKNYKLYRLLPNDKIEIKSGVEIDSSINLFSNYLAILIEK